MTSTKRGILLALSLLFSFLILKPADGDLDTSYGTAGISQTPVGIRIWRAGGNRCAI